MLGLIPLRDWVYLGVILGIVSLALYERAHLIHEGEARCLAREKAAAEKQAIQDTKIAQDTTDELQREIDRLRSATAPRAASPVLRVRCYTSPMPKPAGPATAVTPTSPGGGVSQVSQGSGSNGVDVGPGLQFIATAAELTVAYDRQRYEYLKKSQ